MAKALEISEDQLWQLEGAREDKGISYRVFLKQPGGDFVRLLRPYPELPIKRETSDPRARQALANLEQVKRRSASRRPSPLRKDRVAARPRRHL